MTNETADRLRKAIWNAPNDLGLYVKDLDAALAAERRATAERFLNCAIALSWDDDHGNRVVAIDGLRLSMEDVTNAG